jgi:hypothetical protein
MKQVQRLLTALSGLKKFHKVAQIVVDTIDFVQARIAQDFPETETDKV